MVNDIAVQEFVNAIKEEPRDTNTTYNATVTRVDKEGIVWVNIHGSDKETPTASTSTEVKRGDNVVVNWRNNKLYIGGNYTNPSAGIGTVQPSIDFVSELYNKDITVNSINAATGYIEDLTSKNIKAEDITADHAMIKELDVQSMSAATAYIRDLTADNVTAQDIIADHEKVGTLDATYATIDELHSDYAEIDLANVNNAWIQNGVVKDAAISDAQIIGVSANKLTAGTIDASNITVTNLNADNITTGTINGQRIGSESITLDKLAEEVPTKEYLDNVAENLQGQIDGQIETWTGTVVPTLNNSPASAWTTADERHKHVGDIYYVVNAGNNADGYTYRFTESGTTTKTYSWTLIKDNQITKALQDILDIQGDISDIESFDSQISSWKTDTDEELGSLKSRTSTLETGMGNKVDTTTFNELSQTVDENSASITSLSTTVSNKADSSTVTTLSNTVNSVSQKADSNESKISNLTTVLGTNADGTTASTDIVHKVSDIDQDLDSITTRVATTEVRINGTYATSGTGSGTTAKVATITPAVTGWTLYTGATITVKFTNANTATSPTLNVNSTGAKGIRTFEGGTLAEKDYKWSAGDTFTFVYNGTYWLMQEATTRLKTAEASITTNAGNIALKANVTDVYSKTDANALLEVKANKDTLTSEINASADTVQINANRVNIAGVITAINDNTTTTINGNKITTGTLQASSIYIGSDVLTNVLNNITDELGNIYQLNILTSYTSTGVVHTAQLLQNGVDISAQTPNDFEWNAKLTTGYQFIGNGVSVTIPQSSLNYGHAVTVSWTRRRYAYLLNNSGNNLVTNTGNKLIGRTEY